MWQSLRLSCQKLVHQNSSSRLNSTLCHLRSRNFSATTSASYPMVASISSSQKTGNYPVSTSSSLNVTAGRRFITTSSSRRASQRELFLPGGIVQSPLPDRDFAQNVPYHQFIFDKCDDFKDLPAVTDFLTGKSYTYSQLKETTVRVASALARKGYKKGDIILAFSPNQVDYSVLMLACSCIGAWFCAANPGFTAEDLARQINMSDSIAVFVHPLLAGIADQALNMEAFPHKIKDKFSFGDCPGYQPFQTLVEDDGKAFPDADIDPVKDVLVLPYSSGTTGLPKGVMLSHYNMLANTLQIQSSYRYKEGENILGLLPLYHIYGMTVVQYGALINGSHLHFLPKFDPETFLACMQDSKISTANLVPPLVLFLTKHPMVDQYDLSALSGVICGAAALGREITEAFIEKFKNKVRVTQGYGLTETSPVTHIDLGQNYGSVGPVVCNTIAKVVDVDTSTVCGPGQAGEICVKGPQVMLGYYKNLKATQDMVTEDGWLYTGDIGYYNSEGNFFISDRLKELIKYKGSQVAPAELEALLIGHSEIADVCVVGVPDERAGEVPKAFVVKNPNSALTEEAVIKYIDDQVADFKKLRGGVEFIQEIPKNPSGKILRRLLRGN